MMKSKLEELYWKLYEQMYIFNCCAYNKETLEIVDVRKIRLKENGDIVGLDGLETKDIVFVKC